VPDVRGNVLSSIEIVLLDGQAAMGRIRCPSTMGSFSISAIVVLGLLCVKTEPG
jgi:hypothetical protein